MKTLALEEIYADPHQLDACLATGEAIALLRGGQEVARFVPSAPVGEATPKPWPPRIDFRKRFLEMWGPDAFKSTISVQDEIAELRSERLL